MAKNNKNLNVQSLKSLPSDQLTELAEAILVQLVENSKLKDTFKAVLVKLIQETENQINPDNGVNTDVKKGFFAKIFSFIVSLVSKK
jgi:hypothetical protein